jgi:hypothetical protein
MMMHRWLARTVVLAAFVLTPVFAAAQSALTAADAGSFLGTWTLTLESPQGAFEQTLVLKDVDGKVLGEMSSALQAGTQPVDDITKSGNDLVLKFQGDYQGMAFAAAITMTPDGADKANVTFDVMNGQFVMQGTGVKKP